MNTKEEPISDRNERKQNSFFQVNRVPNLSNVSVFFICSTFLLMAVSFHFSDPENLNSLSCNEENSSKRLIARLRNSRESCDLFKGQWIQDSRGPLYTNYTCKTMQWYKNCFKLGRPDTDFLFWRWKPDQCELPRFDPKEFLSTLRGKTMGFIGDSLARNQMESLLCLLSTAETPIQTYKEPTDQDATWIFPRHNFTLKVMVALYVVASNVRKMDNAIKGAGTFDLHLDKVNPNLFEMLPSLDYAIISNGHWYFRGNYVYENGNLLGCNKYNCGEPNVTNLGTGFTIRKAFRTLFKAINKCTNCKNVHIMLRTYAPEHFQGGAWNKGGSCNNTRPYTKEEVSDWKAMEYRNIQVQEIDRARKEGGKSGITMDIVDITEMMLMRPDGHPGRFYQRHSNTGYKDCLHWCLPGPIDTWNELLMDTIKRLYDV